MIGKENAAECIDLRCTAPNCVAIREIPCSQQGCPLRLGPANLPSSETCDIHSAGLKCATSAELGRRRPQWVSSTKYIPYGHRTDTSNFQWVPSIRYVRRGHDASATGEWRSSVHCAIPRLGGEEKFPVRPHRRVTGGTTYRHSIETCEGEFKTSLRYIPEFQPPYKNWQSSKSHVTASRTKFCTVCPAEVPTNSHLKSILDETCEKWTREGRTKCRKYHEAHPQFNLFHGHAHDVPLSSRCHRDLPATDSSVTPCESSGKTPYAWTARSNPLQPDGKVRGRYIPEGNIDHFECAVSVSDRFQIKAKPLRKWHDGKEHLSVLQRNAISGLLEHKDLVHSPDRHLGQNLYSPAGKVYQYIMDGSFQNQAVEQTQPLTEHRAQYATLKPWVAQETYQATSQACKDNKLNDTSVHPSVNRFLYEDKFVIVS
ncbi:unnamed protein product [Sphagnum jensenii]|uniref:Uncharacterized protein n=1 Tax=Sphagnum jensenii TaxID=128206 RepID=A0ABP1BVG8_9BRYO